ncbi:MAG: type I glyceraldehyde-3-phosphate dehydrogenase [Patescibacteria group bacterium]|jgi:glyceraldehyde 3-phosphate dehydrogenase|nr:type I glyceraldehyde-3-phosphate dehydrogenase [Patescibacteria group bacterium]
MNIAINGFGRIGRAVLKSIIENKVNVNVVAINDLTDTKTLAHLLQYDSSYGKYVKEVSYTKDTLIVGGKKIPVFAQRNPADLPWKEKKVEIVLECTGLFRTKETAGAHLTAGAKKVIISAPAKDDKVKTFVMGVNEDTIKKTDNIVSNASCTTNCLAPVTDVIRQNFGIKNALMTTIHSYTADQNIVDGPHKDLRRARAAAVNIVPTTTGAAIATTKAIPQLKGRFDGMAVRVPTPVGSLCDITFLTNKKVTVESVNKTMKRASKLAKYRDIIEYSDEALVSSDIVGNPSSAIFDSESTKVSGDNLLKLIVWYDNEWGYSNRMVDLMEFIIKKKLV